ncbi:MAG: hypothetical protein ACHQ15_09190, partial [Candidatus Limnocylindrales bacterium]
LDVVELAEGLRMIASFELESARVTHDADSYAFRLRVPGRVGPGLVYSGDCGRADDLRALIRPGDTLLIEIAFGEGPVPPGAQHLDGPAIGALVEATRPGKVLLTHLQMGHNPAEAVASVSRRFSGPIRFVWPGDSLDL